MELLFHCDTSIWSRNSALVKSVATNNTRSFGNENSELLLFEVKEWIDTENVTI
jgi:hypothetical protein